MLAEHDRNGMKQIHLYGQLKNHDGWQITTGKLMFTSVFSFSFQNIEMNAVVKEGDEKHLQAFLCKRTFLFCSFKESLEFKLLENIA